MVQAVIGAALVAFVAALLLGPILLPVLRRLRIGQVIRAQGPARHQSKAGVPTMGGILFLTALALGVIFFAPRTPALGAALIVTYGFGLTGFADDYLKVVLQRPLGLRARHKLVAQLALGAFLGFFALSQGFGSWVALPFTDTVVDLGVFYVPFVILVITGASNAVNITDGLDGLAGGAAVIALSFYLLVALNQGLTDMAVFAVALAGGTAGFLFFNIHPAKAFMGDTGALALGGALGSLAVLTKTELLLPIVAGLFVIEAASVIVQVLYFRLTGGRRLLRMSPLHHHFELVGWPEQRVVTTFWLVALACAGLGFVAMWGIGG
ncbi:MAG TPA: phospho-N-acetylmuramoyl-pentapeptide-transferase [Sphingobacteriaceae bacterium]|nr:phospho-N-acetylmuramoyl-pentapeptide-transferase [Sphingobacteriaceae bacterium]